MSERPKPVTTTSRVSALPSPSRVLEEEDVGRVGDPDAAVADGDSRGDVEAVGEDREPVGLAVAVGVLEDLDPVAARPGGAAGIFEALGDPDPAPLVEGHRHRVDDVGLGGDQLDWNPGGTVIARIASAGDRGGFGGRSWPCGIDRGRLVPVLRRRRRDAEPIGSRPDQPGRSRPADSPLARFIVTPGDARSIERDPVDGHRAATIASGRAVRRGGLAVGRLRPGRLRVGRQVVEQALQGAGLDRLDDVVIEAGLMGAAAILILAPAGQGDDRGLLQADSRRSRRQTS